MKDWADIEQKPQEFLKSHRRRMVFLLSQYSERGAKLKDLTDARVLGRSLKTLKRYCSRHNIKFIDWVPRHMREKKGK